MYHRLSGSADERWRAEKEVGEWLARVAYKPGWQLKWQPSSPNMLSVAQDPMGLGRLSIQLEAEDATLRSDKRYGTTKVEMNLMVGLEQWSMGRDYFFHWLYGEIMQIERHEQDEWFKIDGLNFRNPHPGDSWHDEHTYVKGK